MSHKGVLLGIFSLVSLMAFNNCSGGFNAQESSVLVNNSTAQCRLETLQKSKSLVLKDPSICEEESFYRCDLRRFRPFAGSAEVNEIRCFPVHGVQNFCVSMVTYHFDTRRQIATAEAEDLLEGGAYNRDEASCYHTEIRSRGMAVIQKEGGTFEEALEKTIESCRERGAP